jgi:S1-C subfamily serine protease
MDEVPDSPAELAAIEPGSIIFGVDTKVTRDISQFVNYIEGSKSPGDNIVLDVLTNNGARSAAAVALGERQ